MPLLDSSLHHIRVWRAALRTSVVREMEFRANFILGVVREFAWLGVFILTIESIFNSTTSLAGWEKPHMLILLSLSRIIEGLMQTIFTHNISEIPSTIQEGHLDYTIVKPINSQWYATLRRVTIYNMGNIVAGALLLIYTLVTFDLQITATNVFFTILIATAGIITYYSMLVMVASLGFWFERFQGIYAVGYLLSEPLTVPFTIFPNSARITLTYLIPLAFVVFIPAQALTGRLVWWHTPAAISIAILFLTFANIVWRAGLRRYSSASS